MGKIVDDFYYKKTLSPVIIISYKLEMSVNGVEKIGACFELVKMEGFSWV